MADSKISDYVELAERPANDDLIEIVDVSEASDNDKNKKIKFEELIAHFGTSFPGSPATGKRCYRTDRNIWYFYDGTRWLSEQLFHLSTGDKITSTQGSTTAGSISRFTIPFAYDIYLVSVDYGLFVATTNTGAAYWTIVTQSIDTAAATTNYASTNTSALSPNVRYNVSVAVNAVFDTDSWTVQTISSKTGSPGAFTCYATLVYRLVG